MGKKVEVNFTLRGKPFRKSIIAAPLRRLLDESELGTLYQNVDLRSIFNCSRDAITKAAHDAELDDYWVLYSGNYFWGSKETIEEFQKRIK